MRTPPRCRAAADRPGPPARRRSAPTPTRPPPARPQRASSRRRSAGSRRTRDGRPGRWRPPPPRRRAGRVHGHAGRHRGRADLRPRRRIDDRGIPGDTGPPTRWPTSGRSPHSSLRARSRPRSGGRSTPRATTGAFACISPGRAPRWPSSCRSSVSSACRRSRNIRSRSTSPASRCRSTRACARRDHIDDLQRMELRRAFVGLVLGTIARRAESSHPRRRARDPPGGGPAALPPVPASGRLPVQCVVHRPHVGAAVGDRPPARRIVRRPLRPGARHRYGGASGRGGAIRRSSSSVSTRSRHSTRTGSAGPFSP